MIELPERVPGLRWLTALWGAYGAIWIAFEGDLRRVTLLGVAAALVAIGWLAQRYLGGSTLSRPHWITVAVLMGLAWGAGSVIFTLLFMALKTGLHAHGPEFTAAEINWVWQQLALWTFAGGLAGLGTGLLVSSRR